MKNSIVILIISIVLFSCNEAKKEKLIDKPKTEEIAANYKSIEVDIEGMTCEIGCARTIQSKLSKLDGVTYSKVDFESKKGQFTFDANIVSKDEIAKKIDGLAGGDLYSVSKTVTLEKIIKSTK